MEKKIEIPYEANRALELWPMFGNQMDFERREAFVRGWRESEAQANARIVASGYLVEELVEKGKDLIRELTSAFPTIKIPEQERVYMALHDFNNLLTKATNTK